MRLIFRAAFRSLARNKARSFLTTLGIIIGVAAVIATMAIGQGAGALVQEQIASLGTNAIAVMPGSSGRGGVRMGGGSVTTLVSKDAEAIEEDCPAASMVSPLVRGSAQCIYGDENWYTMVIGTTPSYLPVRSWGMASGSMFTDRDVRAAGKVCVIGKTVQDRLFGGAHPVGQTIRIKSLPFKVLGVLEARGQNALGQDQDDTVLIPLTSAQKKLLGITHVHMIVVSARSESLVPVASHEITDLLCQRHRIAPGAAPDFVLRTQLDLAEAASVASWILTALLLSVASVSLVVGGIGIMNIMLVSVTERTREIGIRRAIGARRRDILFQFLVESVILSVLGGAIGVIVGVGSAVLVTYIVEWPTMVSPLSVLGAFSFSGVVGVFFGFYPARKASLLNPIDALRYE